MPRFESPVWLTVVAAVIVISIIMRGMIWLATKGKKPKDPT